MLIYIEDLAHDNYKEYTDYIKNSIKEIIRIEELDLTALSHHIGITRQTLYRQFISNSNISFGSLNKMNNFLKKYKEKQDEVIKVKSKLN